MGEVKMGIKYNDKMGVFKLDTPSSSYMLKVADKDGFVLHLYYGRKLSSFETDDLARIGQPPFLPSLNERERASFMDCAPFEFPTHGLGDYREDAFRVLNKNGNTATSFQFKDYRIYNGKPSLKGLPATFGNESECETLEITGTDTANGLEITLLYSVFDDVDAIARSVRVKNTGKFDSIMLTKVLSLCTEFYGDEYDVLTLHGSWARERVMDRKHLGFGKLSVSSKRGESSHQEHPFLALMERKADEDNGEVYGFNFVYSGNFTAVAERSQFDTVRVLMGINPEDFSWQLKSGEEFTAPEVISVYSCEGLGRMTRTFHDLYRKHLIRSPYKDEMRPVLINNWEATYFDFNTEKLLSIAKEASALGIEMLVMDDGWFGHRNDDSSSLGDWYVNETKLEGGLKKISDGLKALGMKFGIWMEPEMVSPDSDLYREHPDWAIHLPERKGVQSRAQFVLDLSNPLVVEHTFKQISAVLKSAEISYLKWDMNRQLTDVGSAYLGAENQGELFHRYVLGVYELQERLVTEFPELLLENCSGGGARFDPGMLYYSPQIWTSDDQDPIERLKIQEGTALIYPLSSMGAHVCDCPNHTTGRTTPFSTRGYVALAGTFGYELDVTRISEDDRKLIPAQISMYHSYSGLVREGDYYRVASYRENGCWDCWECVSKDKEEALVTIINVKARVNLKPRLVRLKGLDPERLYSLKYFDINTGREEENETVLKGDALMYAGILATGDYHGDFKGRLLHITGKKQ